MLSDMIDGLTTGEKVFWFACTIGVTSSATRQWFDTKTDWWAWYLVIHAFVFFYAHDQCSENTYLNSQLPQPIHDSFCCKDCKIQGYSQTERIVMFIGALIGIGANVVPKYWKGDEAVRHMVHVKKRKIANPLLFHIVSGICTVVIGGAMSLSPDYVQTDWLMLGLLFVSDVAHQISIHRLLKNHDGIWTLRPGNMQLAVMKWIVMLRVSNHQDMIDLIFFQSCGFLGTRVFVTLVYIMMYLGVPTKMFEEDWYSIGLVWAQFWIYARFWDAAAPVVWISIIASSALYFHQLWREYITLRNLFVLLNCVGMTIALTLPTYLSFAFTLLYWCTFFFLPGFKRQPLFGHLEGQMKHFKHVKNKRESIRLEKKLLKARKSLEVADGDLAKAQMAPAMKKFLSVAEYRESMRASVLQLGSLMSLASGSSMMSRTGLMKSAGSMFSSSADLAASAARLSEVPAPQMN